MNWFKNTEPTYGGYHSYREEKSPWEVPRGLRNIVSIEPLGLSRYNLSLILFDYCLDLEAPVAWVEEVVLLRYIPEQVHRQLSNLDDPVRGTRLKILQLLIKETSLNPTWPLCKLGTFIFQPNRLNCVKLDL